MQKKTGNSTRLKSKQPKADDTGLTLWVFLHAEFVEEGWSQADVQISSRFANAFSRRESRESLEAVWALRFSIKNDARESTDADEKLRVELGRLENGVKITVDCGEDYLLAPNSFDSFHLDFIQLAYAFKVCRNQEIQKKEDVQKEVKQIAIEACEQFEKLVGPPRQRVGQQLLLDEIGGQRQGLIRKLQEFVDLVVGLEGEAMIKAAAEIERLCEVNNCVLRKVDELNQPIEDSEFLLRVVPKRKGRRELLLLVGLSASIDGGVELSSFPAFSAVGLEKLSSDRAIKVGRWALHNRPDIVCEKVPEAGQLLRWDNVKDACLLLAPEFFRWFDQALPNCPRSELVPIFKAWLKNQEGLHDFSALSPEGALAAKKSLAISVQNVIDELGLTLICGKQGCGQNARLLAARFGTSRGGQFYFSHLSSVLRRATTNRNSSKTRSSVQHCQRSTFPDTSFR